MNKIERIAKAMGWHQWDIMQPHIWHQPQSRGAEPEMARDDNLTPAGAVAVGQRLLDEGCVLTASKSGHFWLDRAPHHTMLTRPNKLSDCPDYATAARDAYAELLEVSDD